MEKKMFIALKNLFREKKWRSMSKCTKYQMKKKILIVRLIAIVERLIIIAWNI